jgi:hypothetical protein
MATAVNQTQQERQVRLQYVVQLLAQTETDIYSYNLSTHLECALFIRNCNSINTSVSNSSKSKSISGDIIIIGSNDDTKKGSTKYIYKVCFF